MAKPKEPAKYLDHRIDPKLYDTTISNIGARRNMILGVRSQTVAQFDLT